MIIKTAYSKYPNILFDELVRSGVIKRFKEPNIFQKLLKKKVFADIFFHSGTLTNDDIEYIKESKLTITNSFSSMNLILAKTKVSHEKVKVIYPSIVLDYKKPKELKNSYLEKLNIYENTKLILFRAKNFKNSGVKEFLDICSNLTYLNFKIIIVGSKQQLNALEFALVKYPKLDGKIVTFDENSCDVDELFLISDIFLLPTSTKAFATNILKAMYCKCVVFLPVNNDAKEIIDVYSSMDSPHDPSTAFKIDAILYDEKELKKVKKANKKIANECSLESNLEKFKDILSKI